MPINAGDLRHRVELQAPATVQNPVTGEMAVTWTTAARPYAEIVPLSAREFLAAGAEQSEVRARMTIRYRDDVTAAMRVVYRGKAYNIHGVMPDRDSGLEYLTLMVGEGAKVV